MGITIQASDAINMLEPGVIYPDLDPNTTVYITENHTNLSLCISAKRTADALERLAAAFEYEPDVSNFFNQVGRD